MHKRLWLVALGVVFLGQMECPQDRPGYEILIDISNASEELVTVGFRVAEGQNGVREITVNAGAMTEGTILFDPLVRNEQDTPEITVTVDGMDSVFPDVPHQSTFAVEIAESGDATIDLQPPAQE